MKGMQAILDAIKEMQGVHYTFTLDRETVESLIRCESGIKAVMNISVRNTGLDECLKRDMVLCIIKDTTFRPPPEPTVLLVGDDDLVMGRELLPHEKDDYGGREDVIFLSEDFVIFPDVKATKSECFLMPPVTFPELEAMECCRDVVSCSPSAPSDMIIRQRYGVADDPDLASILVAFNGN